MDERLRKIACDWWELGCRTTDLSKMIKEYKLPKEDADQIRKIFKQFEETEKSSTYLYIKG